MLNPNLDYEVVTQLITSSFVEGDEILYTCTSDQQIRGNQTSVCRDDGQWSLQTLPSCGKSNLLKFVQ